jgi:hypothetical protein
VPITDFFNSICPKLPLTNADDIAQKPSAA